LLLGLADEEETDVLGFQTLEPMDRKIKETIG
jgi:hypothetical protein